MIVAHNSPALPEAPAPVTATNCLARLTRDRAREAVTPPHTTAEPFFGNLLSTPPPNVLTWRSNPGEVIALRLSEKRVRLLAKKIAGDMIDRGVVKASAGRDDLAAQVARAIQRYLDMETKIEEEARAILARNPHLPPPGTGEYQAAFDQAKRQVAARKRYAY